MGNVFWNNNLFQKGKTNILHMVFRFKIITFSCIILRVLKCRACHAGLLIRNLGIPTGGNWLKYLFPNLGFDSPAYSQSGNWFPQAFPLVGIDWNIWSQIWDLILQLIPRVGIDSHRNSHWWELIEIFNPKFGILFFSLFPEWELIPTGIPTPTPCPNPFCIMQSKCIWINWNNKNPDMRIYEVLMHSWSELINV